MSWPEFVASIVKSTAWPAVVVITIILFRCQIKNLITSMSELKIGKDGITGKWDRTAAEVWEGLQSAHPESRSTGRGIRTFIAFNDAPQNSLSNAATTIVASWARLEKALRKKFEKTGDEHVDKENAALVEEAEKRGVITDTQVKSLRGLLALRNLAVYSKDSDVSDARVNEYLAMVGAMEAVLEITG